MEAGNRLEERLEERLAGLWERVLAAEESAAHVFVDLRAALAEAEEVARAARDQIRRRDFKVFTKAEVAAVFKVHEDTIARLRKEDKIPYLRLASCVRYTEANLEAIAEVMERPRKPNSGRGKGNR